MCEPLIDNRRQYRLQKFLVHENGFRRIQLRGLSICNRIPIKAADGVGIGVSTLHTGEQRGTFLGLQKCNNPWACPVCSAIAVNRKRAQLTSIITNLRARGYVAIMVTFTIPHNRRQSAKAVYDRLRAVERLAKDRISYYVKSRDFVDGRLWTFQSTECKLSKHTGWHFHVHKLFFIKASEAARFMTDETEAALATIWITAQFKQGEYQQWYCSNAHSLPVFISRHIIENGDYLVKEMCKRDNGSDKSIDPLTLLDSDDPADIALFFEYAEATARTRKFSQAKGLLQFCDDAETLKKNQAESCGVIETAVVASFTYSDWQKILVRENGNDGCHRLAILRAAPLGYEAICICCKARGLPEPVRWQRRRNREGREERGSNGGQRDILQQSSV